MAINNYFDNNDINIYFHMKNHYKKLRSARSTIDNSFSQGLIKSSTPPSSGRSLKGTIYEERQIKNDPHLPNNSSTIKKHSCIGFASETSNTSLNTINLRSRPRGKKNPFEVFSKMQCKPRSQSTGPTKRICSFTGNKKTKQKGKVTCNKLRHMDNKSSQTGEISTITPHIKNVDIDKSDGNRSTIPKEIAERIIKPPRVEEHEYLEFILRITEDIIINNIYTNEDLEKVFQAHIEANKDHLKAEKMEAQLARLCIKLGISYKNNAYSTKNSECYEHFFNSCSPKHNQQLKDCECISKRTLEIKSKENSTHTSMSEEKKQDPDVCNEENIKALPTESNLIQIIESTKQSNSLDVLLKSVQHLSENVQLSGNNNILSYFQNTNISINDEKAKETPLESEENLICNEPALTEKEKLGCLEEEFLFEKGENHTNSIDEIQQIDVNEPENEPNKNITNINNSKELEPNTPFKNIPDENIIKDIMNETVKRPNELDISNDEINKPENLNITENTEYLNCYNVENIEKNDITSSLKQYLEHSSADIGTDLIPIKNNVPNNAVDVDFKAQNILATFPETTPKTTNDQCTQIEIKCSDKECNTNILLNEYHSDDYVLVNGPVFVLETILNSKEKLIVYDKGNNEKHVFNKEKLLADKVNSVQSYDIGALSEAHSKVNYVSSYHNDDFSKLLNSDYDLMPQRDSDPSNKYHNLLTEASTSISNININKAVTNSFTKTDMLLLSDKYELIGQKEENLVPEMDKLAKRSMYENNDHLEYALNQYELKTNSLPKEENNSLNLSDYSVGNNIDVRFREQLPELDVTMKKLALYNVKKNENASESGEIGVNTYTDEEFSQSSTFRSDNEKNSSNSSPNRSYILGKRKLNHPP